MEGTKNTIAAILVLAFFGATCQAHALSARGRVIRSGPDPWLCYSGVFGTEHSLDCNAFGRVKRSLIMPIERRQIDA